MGGSVSRRTVHIISPPMSTIVHTMSHCAHHFIAHAVSPLIIATSLHTSSPKTSHRLNSVDRVSYRFLPIHSIISHLVDVVCLGSSTRHSICDRGVPAGVCVRRCRCACVNRSGRNARTGATVKGWRGVPIGIAVVPAHYPIHHSAVAARNRTARSYVRQRHQRRLIMKCRH